MQRVVCVVLVRQFDFRRFVATFSCMWVIRMTKYIRSNRDIKSNHDRQYAAVRVICIISSHHRIIKCVDFNPIYYVIKLNVASFSKVFSEFAYVFLTNIYSLNQ